MARRERTPEEKYARAYDGFDYDPDDVADDPSDPFLAEMEKYGRSVLDGTYKPQDDPDLMEPEPKKPA
jgi:hypothetical protein